MLSEMKYVQMFFHDICESQVVEISGENRKGSVISRKGL